MVARGRLGRPPQRTSPRAQEFARIQPQVLARVRRVRPQRARRRLAQPPPPPLTRSCPWRTGTQIIPTYNSKQAIFRPTFRLSPFSKQSNSLHLYSIIFFCNFFQYLTRTQKILAQVRLESSSMCFYKYAKDAAMLKKDFSIPEIIALMAQLFKILVQNACSMSALQEMYCMMLLMLSVQKILQNPNMAIYQHWMG